MKRHSKKILALGVVCLILFFLVSTVFAEDGDSRQPIKETTTVVYEGNADKDKIPCPKGRTDQNHCGWCHSEPNHLLKEGDPDEGRSYPNLNMYVRDNVGYYNLGVIDSEQIWEFFDYLKSHGIKEAVIEIMSPGGSLFDAWTIVSYMDKFDGTVETRVRSIAASAGCLIFVAGDMGMRFVDSTALLMWHELYSFKMFSIDTPTSTEDEAKILRKLQDNTNKWLAERTKLTKDEIDERVRRKEFWIDGVEAVEYGFADGYIQ